jgi:hypothetical protein
MSCNNTPEGWHVNGDSIIAIFFGTIGLVLATVQILVGYQNNRALRELASKQ